MESLRSRIRDLNIASWDRENAMKHRVEELQNALQASHSEMNKLQAALDSLRTSAISEKVYTSMATSTNFDMDGSTHTIESDLLCDIPHAVRKEPLRSASVDAGSQAAQTAQSVDRAVRNKHELYLATASPRENIKLEVDEHKSSSFKICTNGPEKPIRKQSNLDSSELA